MLDVCSGYWAIEMKRDDFLTYRVLFHLQSYLFDWAEPTLGKDERSPCGALGKPWPLCEHLLDIFLQAPATKTN